MGKYAFGVDIGGTTVKIGFFNTDGDILDKWEIKTNTANGGEAILPDIAAAIDGKLAAEGISKDDVVGIGMGVPGPVDGVGIVHKCVNLGWPEMNVEEKMGAITGLKVRAGNDANVAALGEAWKGGGAKYNSIIMVTLGTGVGGGIIVDGEILAGGCGAAGEIGHMVVRTDDTVACGCGKCGHLEQYASATGIVRMAKEKLAAVDTPSSLRSFENITAKDVLDEAKAGDELAGILLDELGDMLGKALANLAIVTNPDAFVIGGGVSKAGAVLTDAIEKHYKKYAFHACEDTKIELATLGNDAGMCGCVKMVL